MKRKVKWVKTNPEMQYGAYDGVDQDGNTYHVPANGETCICTLTDGRKGLGWSSDEAYRNACKEVAR
jgi:hypothetical protein